MARKTIEDTLGMQEYNLMRSLRFINNNPDLMNVRTLDCPCGETINRDHDWHVMTASGILLCSKCANCNSCRRCNASVFRRLVCIDGSVLCYDCLENFGYPIQPAYRLKIVTPGTVLDEGEAKNASNTSKSKQTADVAAESADVLIEYNRKDRCLFLEKKDGRRPLRRPLYDRQAARLPEDRNPLLTTLPYDATRGRLEKMICPACSKIAQGPGRYTVPSIARTYHRACFFCTSCQDVLCKGVNLPGRHFLFCSCEQPQVWCTRTKCQLHRMVHHDAKKCWLSPLRPGGRDQRDTDLTVQFEAKSKATTASKEEGAKGQN